MKKVLIIIGIVLILLIGGIWAYLFLNGAPQGGTLGEIFANFGDAGDAPEFEDQSGGDGGFDDDGESEDPFTSKKRLRQISTRSVAGAVYTGGAVRLMERGTGYVFDVDPQTGSERKVSGLTIQKALRATFASQGDRVAIVYDANGTLTTVLGILPGSGDMELVTLPDGATEPGFTKKGDALFFFVPTVLGGTGYKYTIDTKAKAEVFKTPLQKVRMLWGDSATYFYTTPSRVMTGAVYKAGTSHGHVTGSGKGLTAFSYGDGLLVGKYNESGASLVIDPARGPAPLPLLFPEKCAPKAASSTVFYCGTPAKLSGSEKFPDDWYKGTVGLTDAILEVNVASSSVTTISVLEDEASRPIDIAEMGIAPDGSLLYFVNKYDGGLWVLDLK